MTDSQRKNSFWDTGWRLVSDYWIDVPNGLIPIVLGLLGLLNSGNYSSIIPEPRQREIIEFWTGPLILILTVLSVIFFVLELKQSERFSALKKENESLKKELLAYDTVVDEHTDSFLSSFSRNVLRFGCVSGCYERITIYVHDPSGYFVPIGRHSENPKFKKKGRSKYPDNQGFIAKAWERDFYFENDYPDPETNFPQYARRLSYEGLSANVVSGLTMKPTLLFGYRIEDIVTRKPVALIILETTKNNRYKEKDLQRKFGTIKKDITGLIQILKPIIPIISEPKEFGL